MLACGVAAVDHRPWLSVWRLSTYSAFEKVAAVPCCDLGSLGHSICARKLSDAVGELATSNLCKKGFRCARLQHVIPAGGRAESGRLLAVLVRGIAIVGLIMAAFGPAYSWLALQLVYSERWSATQVNRTKRLLMFGLPGERRVLVVWLFEFSRQIQGHVASRGVSCPTGLVLLDSRQISMPNMHPELAALFAGACCAGCLLGLHPAAGCERHPGSLRAWCVPERT